MPSLKVVTTDINTFTPHEIKSLNLTSFKLEEVTTEQYTQYIVDHMMNGIFWLFSYTDHILAYDYTAWILQLQNSYFDESYDWFFNLYAFNVITVSGFKLFWSIILDNYVKVLLFKLPYDDQWLRMLIASKEYSFIPMYYPELSLAVRKSNSQLWQMFESKYIVSVFDYLMQENIVNITVNAIQLFFLTYILILLVSIYFSFFGSANKEENIIDSDYTTTTTLVESEEDITALDDMLKVGSILFFLFGWFIYNNALLIVSDLPDLMVVFAFLPTFAFIIGGIPSILLLDCGIFFLAYLRGVGPTSAFLLELMYDYIAVIAYYVRLLVQCVRLLLMLFTFLELQEYILYFTTDQRLWYGTDHFWDELNKVSLTPRSITYYLLFKLPTRIVGWIYEVFHTFFILTAQFAAFLAMVFWLFFFLYTFFVAEKLERHLNEHRTVRMNILLDLKALKNNKKASKEYKLTLKRKKIF